MSGNYPPGVSAAHLYFNAERVGWSAPSRPRDDHGVDGIARTLWEVAA